MRAIRNGQITASDVIVGFGGFIDGAADQATERKRAAGGGALLQRHQHEVRPHPARRAAPMPRQLQARHQLEEAGRHGTPSPAEGSSACGGASRPSPASDAQVAWHSLMDVVALRYVFGRNRLQLQSLTPPPRTTTMTTPPMTSWPPLLPLKHPFIWPYYSQSPGGGDGYVVAGSKSQSGRQAEKGDQ